MPAVMGNKIFAGKTPPACGMAIVTSRKVIPLLLRVTRLKPL